MGALIAFELAHALRMRCGVEPEALFVSGRKPPSVPERETGIHRLPKDQFVAHVRLLNGTHPDLRKTKRFSNCFCRSCVPISNSSRPILSGTA